MYNDFALQFQGALVRSDFATASIAVSDAFHGATRDVTVGDDSTQPFTVVTWDVISSDTSRLTLARSFIGNDRSAFTAERLAFTIPMLAGYLCAGAPVRGRVYISIEDHRVWPGLSFCNSGPTAFLVPDPVFVSTSGYNDVRQHFDSHSVPWTSRHDVAFWRGATTGRLSPNQNWRELPRVRLCQIANTRPDLFDVGISSIVGIEAKEKDLHELGILKKYISPLDIPLYKYHIDIDGNSNSWPGLFQKLLSGGVVFKVQSPFGFKQWYYNRLEPWVHYVPVEPDMADLIEKVEWVRAHDLAAQLIGTRGRQLATSMDCALEVDRATSVICSALRAAN